MEMKYASVPNQEKGPCGDASLILFKRDKVCHLTIWGLYHTSKKQKYWRILLFSVENLEEKVT